MISKNMAWSLVLLSPYCLDAAAASSSASNGHWEIVQSGSKLTFTKPDHTLKASEIALKEAKHSVKFVTQLAKLNKDIYLAELKTKHPKKAPYRTPRQTPMVVIEDESTSYEDASAEQRKLMLTQLVEAGATLKSTTMLFDSNSEAVRIDANRPYTSTNRGTVLAHQDYNWTPKEVAEGDKTKTVWRSKLALVPEENTKPVLRTLTAMKNRQTASICNQSELSELRAEAAKILVIETINRGDLPKLKPAEQKERSVKTWNGDIRNIELTSMNQNIKTIPLEAQVAALTQKRNALFASLKLDPAQAYRIQAIVDYLKLGSSEEAIFNEAFGTAKETMNNRPAVVRMLAEVERHVQDPNVNAWVAGTYEPKEVKALRAAMTKLEAATTDEEKTSLIETCNVLVSTIHAHALEDLNKRVKQEAIITDKLRADTQPFETQVGDLRNVLRQLNELQTIQAALQEDAPVTAQAASSSAADSSSAC